MLNIIAIQGRLVADPQMRKTTSGKSVASFRVACNRDFKDANGAYQADFFEVVAWDRTAEFVCRYFKKGDMINVAGRLQSRQYQDKNGANRTAVEIVASSLNFCGKEGKAESRQPADEFAPVEDSEDLPF